MLARWLPLLLPLSVAAQTPGAEEFLRTASIVSGIGSRRITLDDGQRKHDALVETEDGTGPTRRDYRLHIAAYELDKILELKLVVPSVKRLVNGRPTAITWFVDDFVMNELDRRRKNIAPPDSARWNRQMQAVRVFDELISNEYRSTRPSAALTTLWDNLLITRQWDVWLTDHTRSFRTIAQLEDPQSLERCDRSLLERLRELNRAAFDKQLGTYLRTEELAALEARRALLVEHFGRQIKNRGEGAVLYELK